MMSSDVWFQHTAPLLSERASGGWLAASPNGSPLAIGVVANTAEEARERFAWALREWAALADRAYPERESDVKSS